MDFFFVFLFVFKIKICFVLFELCTIFFWSKMFGITEDGGDGKSSKMTRKGGERWEQF